MEFFLFIIFVLITGALGIPIWLIILGKQIAEAGEAGFRLQERQDQMEEATVLLQQRVSVLEKRLTATTTPAAMAAPAAIAVIAPPSKPPIPTAAVSNPPVSNPPVSIAPVSIAPGFDLATAGAGEAAKPEPAPAGTLPATPDTGDAIPTFGLIAEPDASPGVGGMDWETVIGANFLSKLGVTALVVGLALFVGYSFAQLNELGRVLLAAFLSIGMLSGGVLLERRQTYRTLGRGLIAGGWAGLYLTAFAAYGVEASRVITQPILATALLFGTAAGMVAHSLRYRSQVATTLAFVLAALALGISDSYGLAIGALLPLAAASLVLAGRFQWHVLRLCSAASCYAVLMGLMFLRPAAIGAAMLDGGLLCLWALYELSAWAGLWRNEERGLAGFLLESTSALLLVALLALNGGVGELALGSTAQFEFAAIAGTITMGVSAIVRAWLLGRREGATPAGVADVAKGGYSLYAWLASACFAAFVLLRFEGAIEIGTLMAEAAVLLALAIRFRQEPLARVANTVLGGSLTRVYTGSLPVEAVLDFAATSWNPQALFTMAHAAGLYVTRAFFPSRAYYSAAGTALSFLTLWDVLPREWVGVAYLLFSLGLLEAARHWAPATDPGPLETGASGKGRSLLYEAWAAMVVALLTCTGVWITVLSQGALHWQPVAAGSLLLYLASWRLASAHLRFRIASVLAEQAAVGGSLVAAAAALAFAVDAKWLCTAWALLALASIASGEIDLWLVNTGRALPRRQAGLEIWMAGAMAISVSAVLALMAAAGPIRELAVSLETLWLLHLIPVAALAAIWQRANALGAHPAAPEWVRQSPWVPTVLTAVVLSSLAWHVTEGVWLGLTLLLSGIALAAAGAGLGKFEWRAAGYLLALGGTLQALFVLPDTAGLWLGLPAQAAAGALLSAALLSLCLLAQWVSRGPSDSEPTAWAQLESHIALAFGWLASAGSVETLHLVVEGRWLTICLGVEAIALLAFGVATNLRLLRLSALALLLYATAKLFFFDLASLTMPYRIGSFFVLGSLLLAASWAYSRFGNRIRQLL